MKDKTFKTGMEYLFMCFPSLEKSTTPESITTWRKLLADVPDQEFAIGVIRLCRETREIYPGTNVVALIREHIEKIKNNGATAEEAWLEVMGQIRKVGNHGTPKWSHPRIGKAVDSIGWNIICLCDMDQLGVHRAHFFKIFNSFSVREERDKIKSDLSKLVGSIAGKMSLTEQGNKNG